MDWIGLDWMGWIELGRLVGLDWMDWLDWREGWTFWSSPQCESGSLLGHPNFLPPLLLLLLLLLATSSGAAAAKTVCDTRTTAL